MRVLVGEWVTYDAVAPASQSGGTKRKKNGPEELRRCHLFFQMSINKALGRVGF